MATETYYSGGAGTETAYAPTGIPVTSLPLEAVLVADALANPGTTPSADTVVLYRDATGRRVLWTYSVAAETASAGTGWKGVEVA